MKKDEEKPLFVDFEKGSIDKMSVEHAGSDHANISLSDVYMSDKQFADKLSMELENIKTKHQENIEKSNQTNATTPTNLLKWLIYLLVL